MTRIAFERDRDWQLACKQRQILQLQESIARSKQRIEENEVLIEQLNLEMVDLSAERFYDKTLA